MGRWWVTCALVAAFAAFGPHAWAQNERARISGTVSAGLGDGGPAPAIGVAGGFQLAPHAGLELELLWVPAQELRDQGVVIASQLTSTLGSLVPPGVSVIFPTPRVDINGRTAAFLSSFVVDLPVGRLRPYALFGGGMANVEREISVSFEGLPRPLLPTLIFPPAEYTVSTNHLALTAGAGLDVRVWERLSVAADVRYLRLFVESSGARDNLQNITRVGARTSWWF
jgi:opacity protein-like surface antigen